MNRNIRIGIFTAVGVAMIIGFSVFVNDHPYWYAPCNSVKIHVDDATGLRRKSPVKTLGLEIGYIHDVGLDGPEVLINVCVTGPVRLTADTRAYVRSAGFLGDKFLELKPVEMKTDKDGLQQKNDSTPAPTSTGTSSAIDHKIPFFHVYDDSLNDAPNEELPKALAAQIISLVDSLIPSAQAEEDTMVHQGDKTLNASRDTELQDMMKKAMKLMDQLSLMVGDLREVTQQKEFKETIVNLNGTLKNLQSILRPDGKMVKNLDASLDSMHTMMDQANQVMQKLNNGQGTLGKFINDASIYDEMKAALQNLNLLLGKAGTLKTFVDLSIMNIPAYNGNRGSLSVMIQPNPTRYYMVGITNGPEGKDTKTTTTTSVNGGNPVVVTQDLNEEKGLRITALFGKYYGHLELKAGIINDDGAAGFALWADPARRFGFVTEVYSPGKGQSVTARIYGRAQVWSAVYFTGGVDSIHKYNGRSTGFFGAGIFFDDDDLKYLLVFK